MQLEDPQSKLRVAAWVVTFRSPDALAGLAVPPGAWFVACLFLSLLFVPLYIANRDQERSGPLPAVESRFN